MLAALALAVLPLHDPGEVAATVGPAVAPPGCPIAVTLSNDTTALVYTGICPFVVKDAAGEVVYDPTCFAIAYGIPPDTTFETWWDQTDDDGEPVSPGDYVVELHVPGDGLQAFPVTISPEVEAALVNLGAPVLGTERDLFLCAPERPGATYLVAASFGSSHGVPSCGGTVPLDLDLLLVYTLLPDNGIVLQHMGELDAAGQTLEPSLALPTYYPAAGMSIVLAFVTLDLGAPCAVTTISEPLHLDIP